MEGYVSVWDRDPSETGARNPTSLSATASPARLITKVVCRAYRVGIAATNSRPAAPCRSVCPKRCMSAHTVLIGAPMSPLSSWTVRGGTGSFTREQNNLSCRIGARGPKASVAYPKAAKRPSSFTRSSYVIVAMCRLAALCFVTLSIRDDGVSTTTFYTCGTLGL